MNLDTPVKDLLWSLYYKPLGNARRLRAFGELTNKNVPTIRDIALLPMGKVAAKEGVGRTTIILLIRLFQEQKIETRYQWSTEVYARLCEKHLKPSIVPVGHKPRPCKKSRERIQRGF